MIDMRTYRKTRGRDRNPNEHNVFVTLRGDAKRMVFTAKEKLEKRLGDRVSWQVFLSVIAQEYLDNRP